MAKSNGNGTEVAVKQNGSMVAFDPTKFQAGAANMKKAAGGRADFLRMDKSGDWFYGTDDTPVTEANRIYIDPMGSVHGWQCWADTDIAGVQPDLLEEVKAPHYENIPERPDHLPANGREWAVMYGISAILDDGSPLTYTTTSHGGKNALADLYDQITSQFGTDPSKMIPVVKLTNDWYKHKKYGKTFVPVFEVVDWVSEVPAPKAAATPKATSKAPPPATKKAPAKTARRSS